MSSIDVNVFSKIKPASCTTDGQPVSAAAARVHATAAVASLVMVVRGCPDRHGAAKRLAKQENRSARNRSSSKCRQYTRDNSNMGAHDERCCQLVMRAHEIDAGLRILAESVHGGL